MRPSSSDDGGTPSAPAGSALKWNRSPAAASRRAQLGEPGVDSTAFRPVPAVESAITSHPYPVDAPTEDLIAGIPRRVSAEFVDPASPPNHPRSSRSRPE